MKNLAMQDRLNDEVRRFLGQRRSLQLATLGSDGAPFASYAPFAFDEQNLFVLLSDIATHGANLSQRPTGSVLIIEDEDSAEELFARKRVSYQVSASELTPESAPWQHGIELLATRHGDRAHKLSGLSDFRLFCLTPLAGRYVKGFGKAYTLSGGLVGAQIDHLRIGHRPRSGQAA